MSNYTVTTNFLAKDSLVSGNPAKLVKGADLTVEFTNIAAAIATKFDGTTVYAPDGSNTQPSFGFTNNAGTGMYQAAGVLSFATAAAQRVFIGTGGNVTINNPTGGVGLTVAGGGVAVTGTSSFAILNSTQLSESTGGVYSLGANTFSVAASQVQLGGGNSAQILQVNGSAASNNKAWDINANSSGQLTFRAINDANNSSATWFQVNRSGATITSVQVAGLDGVVRNVGYLAVPMNVQAGSYTAVLSDEGKMICPQASSSNVAVPANASVAFELGATLSFFGGGNIMTISINTDTMYLAGSGTTGTRTLAAFGVATAIKIQTNAWVISGTGLT